MTVTRHKLTSKAATVEKALRMSVLGVRKVSKPSKYGNTRTTVDGREFASKAEAKRYQELRLLEKAGKISGLELQVPFKLVAHGRSICKYLSDFNYYDNDLGYGVTEDVKGVLTPEFKLKARLFEAQYGYSITIIKAR